jgi:hypothetical protein
MLLSARMFGLPWLWIVEGDDEVVQDLTVHLGKTSLTAGFGGGDQLQGLLPQTPAKCPEISLIIKPFAVKDNTISSMPSADVDASEPSAALSRRWCHEAPPIPARPLTRAAAKFIE